MKKRWYDNPEEDPFYVALGQAVERRRKALSLTQQQVADLGGISRSEVQFIENAKRRENLQTIRRCCYALNDIWLAELFLEVERHTYREGLNGPILAGKLAAEIATRNDKETIWGTLTTARAGNCEAVTTY